MTVAWIVPPNTTAQVRGMAILAMSPTGVPPVVSSEFSEFAGAGCPCLEFGRLRHSDRRVVG